MSGDSDSDSKVEERDVGATESEKAPVSREVLDVDTVYAALGHPRRRYLCYTLYEDTEWSLTDIARKIAAWENDIPPTTVTDAQLRDVYVSLYHAHIPKLVDLGVVMFDRNEETVSAAHHAEQVLTALEGIGGSFDSNQEVHARDQDNEREP